VRFVVETPAFMRVKERFSVGNARGFQSLRENKISGIFPATNSGAPYLARFREMWDSANLNLRPVGLARFWGIELRNPTSRENERDMGHPSSWQGKLLKSKR
jgi:hypothetical protein